MPRIYNKNGFVVARDPEENTKRVDGHDAHGNAVATPEGHTTDGGLILIGSQRKITTSTTSHEVEILSAAPDSKFAKGERVIVYLGGDDGEISAAGISAFVSLDGAEAFMIHEKFIWARVKDGEVLPVGNVVLTQRDDEAMRWYSRGAESLLAIPEANLSMGLSATGSKDPNRGGDRVVDSVTALYERVYRTGPDVSGVARGDVVCFSPSYSATKLKLGLGSDIRYFHLVDADEIFFSVE
jgi:hypothetical protein